MSTKQELMQQFDELQRKQSNKVANRKNNKIDETAEQNVTVTPAFGIDDDLELKLSDPTLKADVVYSEELIKHLNDEMRELKDETGRLYKLLSERDLELRQLRKKKAQADTLANATGGVAGEAAATKIVDLSKKVRELSAELAGEKSKTKQWTRKCLEAEQQLKIAVSESPPENTSINRKNNELRQSVYVNDEDKKNQTADMKALQDKFRITEQRLSETRNQCQSLRQELKMAQKVLTNEVGDGVTIQSLMSTPGGWRGRNQQILTLQKKVHELKGQVEMMQGVTRDDCDLEAEFMGSSTSAGSSTHRSKYISALDERQRENIRKIDREKKEQNERQAAELKALENDYDTLKGKLDSTKSRNKVISNEVKSLKSQLQTLLDKGKHDDELIQALMKQQTQLRKMIDSRTDDKKSRDSEKEDLVKELSERLQHETNTVQQLQNIVTDKQGQIQMLEAELEEIKIQKLQAAQLNGVNSLFERAASVESRLDSAWSIRNEDNTQIMSVTEDDAALLCPSSRLDSRLETIPTIDLNQQPQSEERNNQLSARRMEGRQNNTTGSRPNSGRPNNGRPNSGRPNSGRPSSGRLNSGRKSNAQRATSGRPDSQSNNSTSVITDLRHQLEEVQIVHQATEVERSRLAELIHVLQRRLEQNTAQLSSVNSDLQVQRRHNVSLEKQLGRLQIEQNKNSKRNNVKQKSTVATSIHNDVRSDENSMNREELEDSLSLQRDENMALKAALQSTLKAKEEDLNLYNEIMEQTKLVFLEGLKQYKQKQT